MAKINSQTSDIHTNSFLKGLNKDSDPSFVSEGMWTHARNASNNSREGDLGTISNEPSTVYCAEAGLTIGTATSKRNIIGSIYLFADKWVIFTVVYNSTGLGIPIGHEIGLFEEDICRYRIIVQDSCLNFSKYNLISGASRLKEDCGWGVYWADGKNPDRYMDIGDPQTWPSDSYTWFGDNQYISGSNKLQWPGVPWNQDCNDVVVDPFDQSVCTYCTNLTTLNCDELRLAKLMGPPCVTVNPAVGAGTLRNGSYAACIAYVIKGQVVSDYFALSNQQPIYNVQDLQGSIDITIEADSTHFDEFELVVIQTVNQGTVAKRIGIYSTKTTNVHLDQIKEDLITIPLELIFNRKPVYEKSDQMLETNNYLLRVGPTSKFDFNYQPLANLIRTNWVSVEYPQDYYYKGGKNAGYLRDEVYAFFIRWVYNTGDKSVSYHIPGRAAKQYTTPFGSKWENSPYTEFNDINSLEGDTYVFQTYNTANETSVDSTVLPDGGKIIARGNMAYWQSTEHYPSDKQNIWNASAHCWTGVSTTTTDPSYDLCGLPIRHHKFPNNDTSTNTYHFSVPSGVNITDTTPRIRIMGVEFNNIIYPKDNDGNDIPGIVGYEILRGSREGNRSIIAKGMINNLRTYDIQGAANNKTTGLYPNYPFNTIDPYGTINGGQYNDPYIKAVNQNLEVVSQTVPSNIVTFHSPDTSFRTPFLSGSELKLYGRISGVSNQQFIFPDRHPQFKLLGNAVVFPMYIAGVVQGIISFGGKYTMTKTPITGPAYTTGVLGGGSGTLGVAQQVGAAIFETATGAYNTAMKTYFSLGEAMIDALAYGFSGARPFRAGIDATYFATLQTALIAGAVSPNKDTYDLDYGAQSYLDPVTRALNAVSNFAMYFSEGADLALRTVYALLPYRQYAVQSIAHGFYNKFFKNTSGDTFRFNIPSSFYLKDTLQDVPQYNNNKYRINNLKRSSTVVVRTTNSLYQDVGPRLLTSNLQPGESVDDSLMTIGTAIDAGKNISTTTKLSNTFNTNINSHYAGIKFRIDNQYGQLDSVKQITVTNCEQKLSDSGIQENNTGITCQIVNEEGIVENVQLRLNIIQKTPAFFGGDTYINRYAEKNSMFFFYDWLFNQPDGTEYNYFLRQMIPQPRFWVNSTKWDINNITELFSGDDGDGFFEQIKELATGINDQADGVGAFPTSFYNLDYNYTKNGNVNKYDYSNDSHGDYPGFFGVKNSYFYLANSSIRDFFVESEVIVDFREAGDLAWQKVYNPFNYTDLSTMFNINPEVITRGNYCAYDYSLSATKVFTQYFSQGNLQSRYYNPDVAELCYVYRPNRIVYSLPQEQESYKDSWFIYLVNNYKDFKNHISGVKNFAKTGIFITFSDSSPLVYQGVDTLQTDAGTKITIGDGGLFNQTPQNIVVADNPYEYGSSQNRLGVISTPAGMFYMSQNQGKIFSYEQGILEISQQGLKWWFNIFMPYKLTEDFPNYPYTDNPVAGIGCQSIYDNQNSIVYFCKKDYKLKPEYAGSVEFNEVKRAFIYKNVKYDLGDPFLFENASWTVSYDPKTKFWISFHDWHPDLVLPSKNSFLSTKGSSIWQHNNSCVSYCNYYGKDYPFEVEFPITEGQQVKSLRSIEYILECSKRSTNCIDQYQVLDFNFDKAVVFNSEQVSGYLNLNIFPKNNITLSLEYPKLNPGIIVEPTVPPFQAFDILFSKEENKYRFNQFWDITKDRGEFPIGSTYPPTGAVIPGTTVLAGPHTEEFVWNTQSNGYIKTLNSVNLNYNKEQLQKKKFRHYLNSLYLRKDVSGDVNMILKIVNSKNLLSPR